MNLPHLFRSLFLFALLALASSARAATKEPEIIIEATGPGEIVMEPATGMATATNGVIVRYGAAVLTSDHARINQQSGDVEARGRVTLTREGTIWRGEAVNYNFKSGQMGAEAFRIGLAPLFAEGRNATGDQSNNIYTATSTFVTTDDYADPGYRIRARSMTVAPGQYVAMRNATLYLGDVPVFFWPYYRRSLERHPINIELTPGYRSIYGPYLLGTLNAYWSSNFVSEFHLDYRVKRGLGGGPGVGYDLGKAGHGKFDYYYTHDQDPGTNLVVGTDIPADRHRLRFLHDATLGTNLLAKAVINYQSDPQIVRDFFESEFKRNRQPGSFIEFTKLWPNFSLDLLAQPRVTDFFETVERLPDVKFAAARQQLGPVPIYYEGENSIGYFRYETNATPRYSAWRADSFHQLLAPQTFLGWLNVTPRAGGRFTHYGEADGRGTATSEADRWVFNTGAEVSFKASRVWRGATNSTFEIDGLRHIVEPMFNYAYVPTPNKRPLDLPQFDTILPSLRPLPIDFPRFNDIDSIDSENTLRMGLRNKLQTKRRGEIENVIDWDAFVDWRLRPRPDQRTFGDFVSALDLRPRSWLTLNSEVRYAISDGALREANHELYLQPGSDWSIALGHRYFNDDALFGPDSAHNLLTSRLYWRVNENWALRISHRFEARDGTLEEQYYTIYRDLRSWTAALTLRVRDDRSRSTDVTVALTLSLKAFPRFAIGHDRDEPSNLLGY